MKYFVCNCFYELKLGCGVISIKRLIAEDFIDFQYLIFVKNDCYYICCKKTIRFLFDCYCNSCSCATINDSVSSIEMIEFVNEDICQICKKTYVFIFAVF